MTQEEARSVIISYYQHALPVDRQKVVSDILSGMHYEYYRILLLKYGHTGYTWRKIAMDLHPIVQNVNPSISTVRRWHNRALQVFGELVDEFSNR